MRSSWFVDRYMAYLNTWSGIKQYVSITGENPVAAIRKELCPAWGNNVLEVNFRLFGRVGSLAWIYPTINQ